MCPRRHELGGLGGLAMLNTKHCYNACFKTLLVVIGCKEH